MSIRGTGYSTVRSAGCMTASLKYSHHAYHDAESVHYSGPEHAEVGDDLSV